ncbi:PKD domain-containing protein [Salinarchaeum sp. IM2453]|uniref:PKD domain-containing protein n=1 Tax=Salinarchaeum sp. IM2453 TaxID=2862870 RepID=UPI001C82D0EE|nr:PKD domain-containing protein [Salinarchaeum sp. IM2453]QZA89026.1 PKD domain-containing protein [Salinarchaeum sp. IM2453]
MRQLGLICLVVCLGMILVSGVAAGTTADTEPDIITDSGNLISIPEETVEHGGDEYTITDIAYVPGDESIEFDHDVPSGELELRSSDEERLLTNNSLSIDAAELDAGTYAVLLLDDASIEAVQPLVISGYKPTVEEQTPDTPGPGDEVTVEFSLNPIDDAVSDTDIDAADVEVGFTADNDPVIEQADATAEEHTYTVDIPLDADLSADAYQLHVSVRGSDTAFGLGTERIAFSPLTTLDVSDDDSSSPTDPSPPSDDPSIDGVDIESPAEPTVNDSVTFSTNLTTEQAEDAEFTWEIDGMDDSGESIEHTHTFDSAGTYNVSLTVDTDDESVSDTTTITITENDHNDNNETDNGDSTQELTNQTNDNDEDDPIPLSIIVPVVALTLGLIIGLSRTD